MVTRRVFASSHVSDELHCWDICAELLAIDRREAIIQISSLHNSTHCFSATDCLLSYINYCNADQVIKALLPDVTKSKQEW